MVFTFAALEESALDELLRGAGQSGPFAVILSIFVYVIIRYWIIPKAEEDIKKTAAEREAALINAKSLALMAETMKEVRTDYTANFLNIRNVAYWTAKAVRANHDKNERDFDEAVAAIEVICSQELPKLGS